MTLEADRMSEEGRFFQSMGRGQVLWAPRIPPAAMVELQWLKEKHQHLQPGAGWFDDRIYICGQRIQFERVWTFDEMVRGIRDVTSEIDSPEFCSSIRWEAPLFATFEKKGSDLFWELGPHRSGQYALLFEDGVHAYEVPRADGFRIGDYDALKLRVRYLSAEGWSTYSPELALDFTDTPVFRWSR